jgi:hypothetical protein
MSALTPTPGREPVRPLAETVELPPPLFASRRDRGRKG